LLEKGKEATSESAISMLEYARFADDLVVLVDGYHRWMAIARVYKRLLEELAKL